MQRHPPAYSMILFSMMIIFADINRKNEEGKCNAIVTDRKMVLQRIKALEKKMIIMLSLELSVKL